jgi:lycopene cyclase domain-containing protein
MSYTALAGSAVLAVIAADVLVLRTRILLTRVFWCSYAILLFFQLVVNGVLTGMRIVRYNPDRIIEWRIMYAPVEDLAFGFSLITLTLSCWVWLTRYRSLDPRPADDQAEELADR